MAGAEIAAGRVDEGMTIFSTVVRGRAQRLVTEVMALLPDAARYAGDAVEDAVPAIDVPDIAEAVGLPPASRPIRDDTDERLPVDVEELIGRAAEAGSATELRDLVVRARALGMQVRANRQSVGLMAPRDRRKALITLRPTPTGVMVWAQAHVIAVGYPGRLEALITLYRRLTI